MIVTIYDDDLLIFTNERNQKKKLKAHLQKQLKMKDLGEAKHCLGITITRNREEGKLWLDQQAYIDRFALADAHPGATPAASCWTNRWHRRRNLKQKKSNQFHIKRQSGFCRLQLKPPDRI